MWPKIYIRGYSESEIKFGKGFSLYFVFKKFSIPKETLGRWNAKIPSHEDFVSEK